MARVGLAPPWEIYYAEMSLLFKEDPQVTIFYNADDMEIKLYVDNAEKADALARIIPEEVEFGNVTLKNTIIPSNNAKSKLFKQSNNDTYEVAFDGNPIVSKVVYSDGLFDFIYVVFKKKVVQYYNDNISDANGVCSTLYQDMAKRIFKDVTGVFYCTDV